MPDVVEIKRCAHRKTNGIYCGSPALKDKPFCFFHHRYREQHVDVLDGTPIYQSIELELPLLEDANAIQICLTKVIHMLMAGMLEPKFARTLIYGLSIAAQNLKNCNFSPKDEELGANEPARRDQSEAQGWGPTDIYHQPVEEEEDTVYTPPTREECEERAKAIEDMLKAVHAQELERLEALKMKDAELQKMQETEAQWQRELKAKRQKEAESADPENIGELQAAAEKSAKPKRKTPKSIRTWPEPDRKKSEPKPKINLFDRLAERRAEYKRIAGVS